MPKIKTKREDILRRTEIETMLKSADPWLACLIALAWMFGKRISELLQVTKEDIWKDRSFLYVRFHVGKKQSRKDAAIPQPYIKRITRKHPGVAYVLDYLEEMAIMDEKETRLFPKMYYQKAQYYLKKLNPQAWWHLFRQSLATEMAEHGATEEQLLHWFDWDRVDTAHDYVKHGVKLTEELSSRTW